MKKLSFFTALIFLFACHKNEYVEQVKLDGDYKITKIEVMFQPQARELGKVTYVDSTYAALSTLRVVYSHYYEIGVVSDTTNTPKHRIYKVGDRWTFNGNTTIRTAFKPFEKLQSPSSVFGFSLNEDGIVTPGYFYWTTNTGKIFETPDMYAAMVYGTTKFGDVSYKIRITMIR